MQMPQRMQGMRDIFNRAIPQFDQASLFGQPTAPPPQPMPQFQPVQQNYTPQTGGPTPRTPVPNPMPHFQALMQNFRPPTGGPTPMTPQQPPPFEPPQPMPFIEPRPMQMQMPNFSYLGGQTAPPDPMMMMPPNMKGMFGVR